jgi:hypothetical protein
LAALSPRATIAATTQCGERHSTSRRELEQLCKTNGAKPGPQFAVKTSRRFVSARSRSNN